jgi:hypothetical protein
MAATKPASSPNLKPARPPYAPISHTWEIPAALFEIKALAQQNRNNELIALVESVIMVSGADPHTWQKLNQPEAIPASLTGG